MAALVSPELESLGFLVAFSERSGGASAPPFAGLNLSVAVGDDEASVRRNRDRLGHALGVERVTVAHQVHGSAVATVDTGSDGQTLDGGWDSVGEADVLMTGHRGVGLAVLVADCVPVALVSHEEGTLAVVHAGWRGLVAGAVTAAVRGFGRPASIRAVIGPCVGVDHYAVGEDVAARVAQAAGDETVVARREGGWFADLSAAVASVLAGHEVEVLERADLCTACLPDAFFSHRRDGVTGRQALVAVRR
jgi:polyphenol oxidase